MDLLNDEKFYENDYGVYFKSGYLSQWYISPFIFNNIEYNCCEQYMMSEKAKLFNDDESYKLIMNAKEPKEHKKLGRLVKNFDEIKWNKYAEQIVFDGNYAKFTQNLELKKKLIDTNDKIIIECSPYDNIWGNGLNISDTLKTNIYDWKGKNKLGNILMKVRDIIRK